MIDNTKKINFSFRVSPKRQEELKIASARRKQSVQEMLERGLDLLLTDSVGREIPLPSSPSPYAPENHDLHDKLELILNSGDAGTIRAVVPNIEIFHERLKPNRGAEVISGSRKRVGGK